MSDQKQWKLEGKGYQRVKMLQDHLDETKERAKKELDELHAQLWGAIYEECGITSDEEKKKGYRIITKYKNLDILFIEREGSGLDLAELLGEGKKKKSSKNALLEVLEKFAS